MGPCKSEYLANSKRIHHSALQKVSHLHDPTEREEGAVNGAEIDRDAVWIVQGEAPAPEKTKHSVENPTRDRADAAQN